MDEEDGFVGGWVVVVSCVGEGLEGYGHGHVYVHVHVHVREVWVDLDGGVLGWFLGDSEE